MTFSVTSSVSPVSASGGWRLEHSYAALPPVLYEAVLPTVVKEPRLVIFNQTLAVELGLDAESLAGREGAEIFAGNRLPSGARPIAQAYAGHQYGHFTVLGDGRAILLGEQITPRGERRDIQLKGAGPTPFSRRGDGRAALGPMLREYIISEAMQGLGIPTTRSLAVVATGETVWRQSVSPGAVLTRVAASHIRVGTFQWAAAKGDEAALRALTEYTLRRHFPERAGAENAAMALLRGVIERQAALLAQWQLVGFVHGVMNTDNMALSGETIEYGPCAFMEAYDPATVFSSIDRHGRYAYGNQPVIAQWNLTRLAEALLMVLDPVEARAIEIAQAAVKDFGAQFHRHLLAGWRRKLGLFNAEAEDGALVEVLLAWMQAAKADFTNTFVALSVDHETQRLTDLTGKFETRRSSAEEMDTRLAMGAPEFVQWRARWVARLERQSQSAVESAALRRANNPAVIPRNHRVELALAAAELGDLAPMEQLLDALRELFDHERVRAPEYRVPAAVAVGQEAAERYRTFCGT
jgi:serine/tyrosine/threonine adenylyltransferase